MDLKIFTNNIEDAAFDQIHELASCKPFENAKIRIMPDVHAGKGCVIGFTADLGDKVIPNVVGVDIGCVDKDTEFITPNGFKKISEYKKGDLVLQYDPQTDEATFVTPTHFINKPCDTFYHFKNTKGLDQMVSADHRMLVYKGFKGRGYTHTTMSPNELTQQKLNNGFYSFKAAYRFNGKGIPMTDDEIRLKIAICADGYIRSGNTNLKMITFHFSKERKKKRLRNLLSRLRLQYTEQNAKDNTTTFYLSDYNNDLDKYNKTMNDLYNCNHHQLKIITDEVLYWDGHKGYRSYFSSTNKKFADFIQFAFAGTNTRAGINTIQANKNHWSDTFCVTPTKNQYVAYTTAQKISDPSARAYCFTVPSSFFVTRRNGKIAITGNCGMLTVDLGNINIDFPKLDKIINKHVPSGFNVHQTPNVRFEELQSLKCYSELKNIQHLENSLGTLGGGNHFIEIDIDNDGNKYLIIHSGSRNLGKQVAEYYQHLAIKHAHSNKDIKKKIVEQYKAEGREQKIAAALKAVPTIKLKNDLCYIENEERSDYLHDMAICQRFATLNRKAIANIIISHMNWETVSSFETIHNYIELETNIVRKGAISAKKDERVLIPMNMRDGCIIGVGKGNPEWNFSAPHGAGRLMSRKQAKENISMAAFENSMKGIYTTSIDTSTLDESPMAYKPIEEIIKYIKDTVEIEKIIKPIYNFKAKE